MRSVNIRAAPHLLRCAIVQSDFGPILMVGDVAAFAIAREILGYGGATSYTRLLPITLGILLCVHAYRPGLTVSVLRDLPVLVPSMLAAITLYYLLVRPDRSIGLLFREALVLLSSLIVIRALFYAGIRNARIRGVVSHPVVLIGNGTVTWHLAEALATHREFGLRPVGVLDDNPVFDGNSTVSLIGGHNVLPEVLTLHRAAHVIVSFGAAGDEELVETLRICADMKCTVFVVPRLYELWDRPFHGEEVWGIPLVRIRSSYGRCVGRVAKRSFDIAVAMLGLILMAPVMGFVASAVLSELGRGVIFKQERIGQHGKRFMLLKFRSLRPTVAGESDVLWNIDRDPRVGSVGRFIRATSLDELPQLWNVLRGDMSIVGPRPERPFYVDQFGVTVPRYVARHRVPAGLTGWAQVHGLRGHTSIEDRVRFDNNYIQRWSFWTDVIILMRTMSHLVHVSARRSAPPPAPADSARAVDSVQEFAGRER